MNSTINYYNQFAKNFFQNTKDLDMSEVSDRFLNRMKPGDMILDLGCGSGRDSLAFKKAGFQIEAIDGSQELCDLASELLNQPVINKKFQEIDEKEKYDGIWACASLLHLTAEELTDVFKKLEQALKPGGILYCSFKYGDFQGVRNGRFFLDRTEESLCQSLRESSDLEIIETWKSQDVRPDDKQTWLNALIVKRRL